MGGPTVTAMRTLPVDPGEQDINARERSRASTGQTGAPSPTAYDVPRAARVQSTPPSPALAPSAASSRLSTLLVAVLGRSGAIRT